MLLKRLYDVKLAQASYLLGCSSTHEAIVVDPNRDIEQYIRAAADEGMRITHVTETHITPTSSLAAESSRSAPARSFCCPTKAAPAGATPSPSRPGHVCCAMAI